MPDNVNLEEQRVREGYAESLIASLMVAFKYGDMDGLSTTDIRNSFEQLKNDKALRIPPDLLFFIKDSMKKHGDETRKNAAQLQSERLAQVANYQQTQQDVMGDISSKDAIFFDSNITIAELYIHARENDWYLLAKDFVPSVWKKVVRYRELVHQFINEYGNVGNNEFEDDPRYDPALPTDVKLLFPISTLICEGGVFSGFPLNDFKNRVVKCEPIEYMDIVNFNKVIKELKIKFKIKYANETHYVALDGKTIKNISRNTNNNREPLIASFDLVLMALGLALYVVPEVQSTATARNDIQATVIGYEPTPIATLSLDNALAFVNAYVNGGK